ncbi:MAG TPA: phosphopantetheine-binding protein, partial [Noviherbaspirillum sp.]|nr:phosphopantetheine-binding protein [Noviherbaspirillum sp.]
VLQEHAAVRQAVVAAWPPGAAAQQLVAYVVPAENKPELAALLRRHVEQALPAYMTPGLYLLLDALPRLPNGKLDRLALPAPDMRRSEIGYLAPRNEIEEILATVWAKVLKLDRVGVRDNFFEFGGNSLLIVKLHNQLAPHFAGRVQAVDLFKHATIEQLALFLNEAVPPVEQPLPDSAARRESRLNRAASTRQRLAVRGTKKSPLDTQ